VKLLPRINSSLMNQVSHGTLNRIFDHEMSAKEREEAAFSVKWGTSGGKTDTRH